MQIEKVQSLIQDAGLSTKLEVCAMPCFHTQLKKMLPQGKVLILLHETVPLHIVKALQEQLHFYKQYLLFLEEKESCTAVFSLPDDIRMVIAIGKKAVKVGRVFATLRGCYSVAIATDFETNFYFCKSIDSKHLFVETGIQNLDKNRAYPVTPLSMILLDKSLLVDRREGILKLANCTFAAIDIELDAMFRGEKQIKNFSLPKCDCEDILHLYFSSILESLTLLQFANFSYLNAQTLLEENLDKKFAFFCYFMERYQLFFQKNLRKYYVPNYILRFQYAMQYFGKRISLDNIEVFTAEQSNKLFQIFESSRFTFIPYVQLLEKYCKKLQTVYSKLSRTKYKVTQEDLALFDKLYNISAESTNLYVPPLLEREFGLLDLPSRSK